MFELFEHKADIGVRGFGKSLEEAFVECAKAMFSIMANLDKVKTKEIEELDLAAESKERLLVDFLNHLLYLRDVNANMYSQFDLYIIEVLGKWQLKGKALGEKISYERHSIKGDVKAATYHQLAVKEKQGYWMAQCVVDV